MDFEFNIDLGMKFGKEKAIAFLDYAGVMTAGKATTNVQSQFRDQTGNLANSIFHKVDEGSLTAVVIANTEYARIQELGGDIKPVNAKALAVPVHPDAKKTAIPEGRSIRDVFPDLVYIKRNSL